MKIAATRLAVCVIPILVIVKLSQVFLASKHFEKLRTKFGKREEDNQLWTDPCTFYKNGVGPIPVVLMALGRSGSSITWSTMSALTGERNIAYEVSGGNHNSSNIFFHELKENDLAFHNWTLQRLCHIQQHRPDITLNTGIAGFQWKPYMSSFDEEYAIEGLKAIAESVDPKVKVVYLTRNPLDRKISNLRHRHSKDSKEKISAHCKVGDEECIKHHSDFDTNIILPTGRDLLKWLNTNVKSDAKIRRALDETHVDYVQISYKKLFTTDDAEEWMKVFRFLGVGPTTNLTMDDVRASFSMAATHTKGRNETVSNFKKVEETLKGTKFEHLLYD